MNESVTHHLQSAGNLAVLMHDLTRFGSHKHGIRWSITNGSLLFLWDEEHGDRYEVVRITTEDDNRYTRQLPSDSPKTLDMEGTRIGAINREAAETMEKAWMLEYLAVWAKDEGTPVAVRVAGPGWAL